ncbi:hypothetical protein [Terasakiella sp.]|uniref:hypothetical protein n=1 Tax=Terasakiella sp. TaxID=2034861 RepID=UPI003AA7D42B
MDWSDVGGWLKDNGAASLGLVGSLLTGNVPGAIAAGASLVASATGTDDPEQAMAALKKQDPTTMLKLEQLANENEANIRAHIEAMTKAKLEDEQAAHEQTQLTVRNGDNAEDRFVRWTRPGQSWVSLIAAIAYVFTHDAADVYVLGTLLALPFSYAGLRQIGKNAQVKAGLGKVVDVARNAARPYSSGGYQPRADSGGSK